MTIASADGRIRVTLDEMKPRELSVTFDPGRGPHGRPTITASVWFIRKRPRNTPLRLQAAFAWTEDLARTRVDFSRRYDDEIAISLWIDSASFELTPREAKRLLEAIPALRADGDAQPATEEAPPC